MKHKSIPIFMIVLMSLATVPLFAEGVQEGAAATADGRYEVKSLSGEIDFLEDGSSVLNTDGQEYMLLYPRYLGVGETLESGEQVTVEGYEVPGPRWNEEERAHLRVSKALIDGKEYDLEEDFKGYGPANRNVDRGSGWSGRPMMGRNFDRSRSSSGPAQGSASQNASRRGPSGAYGKAPRR